VVARVGFEPLGSQAVMVKRLAVRLAEPVLKPLPVVEGQVPTPIASTRYNSSSDEARRTSGLTLTGTKIGSDRHWWPTHAKANH
jgi:hypothetical protein